MKLLIIISTILSITSSITINCNFRLISLTLSTNYGCDGLASNDESREVLSITGTHMSGRTNNDTEVLRLWNECSLEFVPQKAGNFFPNLMTLWLNDCNFQEVKSEDFADYANLKELDLGFNKLEFIHDKAFESLTKLKFLYLNDNKIVFIGPSVFQSMSDLTYVTFEGSSCMSAKKIIFDEVDFRNFIIDVAIQCPLTIKIAERIFKKDNTKNLKVLIEDLRVVMDNAMMTDYVHDTDKENEETNDYFDIEADVAGGKNIVNTESRGDIKQELIGRFQESSEFKFLNDREREKSKIGEKVLQMNKNMEKRKLLLEINVTFEDLEAKNLNLQKEIEKLKDENTEIKEILKKIQQGVLN